MDYSRNLRVSNSSQTLSHTAGGSSSSIAKPNVATKYETIPSPDLMRRETGCTDERRRFQRSWGTSVIEWWREFSMWVLGTGALITISCLLHYFGERPLSHWQSHSWLPISTVVTALAQTAVSTLLVSISSSISQLKWVWLQKNRPMEDIQDFDEASRGPAGSFLLLSKVVRGVGQL